MGLGGFAPWRCIPAAFPKCCLIQFFAGGDLSGLQKGFDEFALPADGQAGKLFAPFAVRHFGFGREPVGQSAKLAGGDMSAADAIKQVREKLWRQIVAANARHGYSP